MAKFNEHDAKKPSGLNYTKDPSPETDFGNEDLGNASLAPEVSHQVNKKTPIAESKLKENSSPMDRISFMVNASGENFGFDGQGDEAMDALEDFGATENENGSYSMILDDFKDWCDTYGLEPDSGEFIITDEAGDEIEDINSFLYDVDDDILDSDLVTGEDDEDFGIEEDDFDDEYGVEDEEYWDDAQEINPDDYDPATVKGQVNWAKAGAEAEDEEEMDAHRDAYKNSYDDWHSSFMDAFNLKDFDGENINESVNPQIIQLANELNADPAIQSRLRGGNKVTPEMIEAAIAKGIRGFLPLQNYFKRVLSPDFHESKKPTGTRMKEDTQAFLNTPKPLAEKEIPAWVMKAFEESKSEAKQFKEWIDNGSISGKFNQMMYFAKKINDLAGELEGAGEPAVAAKLKSISRELR